MTLPPLYKFLNVRGAQLTLGNGRFRHAKPSDFNDVEDLTVQSIFPEEIEAALEKIAHGFTGVLMAHLNDTPTCASPMKEQVEQLQQVFRANPDAAPIVEEEMQKEGASFYDVPHLLLFSEEFLEDLNRWFQDYRILCVTTHKDSSRMWAEYAEDHKGIALRIEPNVAKDSKFKLFRPVSYAEHRPPLYPDALDFVAGSLFGDRDAQIRSMAERIIYSKTLAWAHENEYRLAIPLRRGEQPWDTLPYHPEEIAELYLGAAMTPQSREEIIWLARQRNPDIQIFQAIREAGSGHVTFQQDASSGGTGG